MNTRSCLRKILTLMAMVSTGLMRAVSQDVPTGQFDGQTDVGSPGFAGSAEYVSTNQSYIALGAGPGKANGRDPFHFVWKRMTGDFILRTRFTLQCDDVRPTRQIGWMVRPGLDIDAPFAAGGGRNEKRLPSLLYRRAKGGETAEITLPVTNADVLQFERKGSDFILSAARYGDPFTRAQLSDLPLGDDVYVGLYVSYHYQQSIERVTFRDVHLIKPAKEGFVPYHDYIGSVLEILNVTNGLAESIYHSDQPFEAPNWTPDGRALIYNISGRAEGWGRLCRFDLETKTPVVIDTAPANRNNNDHVLSFDGATLAISDQSSAHGGQSAVFTVPVKGGTPRPITKLTPSYAHGWSPDGKYILYTGGRTNKYDIYKTAADGSGPEIRLTDAPGLNDGPEYTPDGKYIYFNSSRTGRMQLWRMKPDGSEQDQITNDEYNNWFPHISPDGKWIALISFTGDVSPTDHPYYKQVYLRLLPIEGGKPRVIAYVYGGQGTMNVPSWSPDSKRLAFVSNTR